MKRTAKERKNNSMAKIKSMGIACNEWLPMLEESSQVTVKSLDEICKRAIACLLSTQVACDTQSENYDESVSMFSKLLDSYTVRDSLITAEKRLFDGTYSEQDAVNVVWTYEAYWSLVWALGLIDDISDAGNICDCEKAVRLVGDCENFEKFRNGCKLRDTDEILDMLDLYYRYDWAVTEKRIKPDTPIGNLNPEVVMERRRGLEWLISDEDDWFEISMDT